MKRTGPFRASSLESLTQQVTRFEQAVLDQFEALRRFSPTVWNVVHPQNSARDVSLNPGDWIDIDCGSAEGTVWLPQPAESIRGQSIMVWRRQDASAYSLFIRPRVGQINDASSVELDNSLAMALCICRGDQWRTVPL